MRPLPRLRLRLLWSAAARHPPRPLPRPRRPFPDPQVPRELYWQTNATGKCQRSSSMCAEVGVTQKTAAPPSGMPQGDGQDFSK
jgi:hypothetical protein